MRWHQKAAAAARAEAEMLDRERERERKRRFANRPLSATLMNDDRFYAVVYGAEALRAHAKRLDELEALRCEARGHDKARRLLAWILRRRKTK